MHASSDVDKNENLSCKRKPGHFLTYAKTFDRQHTLKEYNTGKHEFISFQAHFITFFYFILLEALN